MILQYSNINSIICIMTQNFTHPKLRSRQVINTQPRLNNLIISNKAQHLQKKSLSKEKNSDAHTIMLQVKMFKTDRKIFNQIVKFLEDTYVEIYKINKTSSHVSLNNKLILRRKLDKGSTICLFDPHKEVFEVPLKVGEIILYGNPSKDGYIIKVKNSSKYEYIIEEYNIL